MRFFGASDKPNTQRVMPEEDARKLSVGQRRNKGVNARGLVRYPSYRGQMRNIRATRRAEAETRNANANAVRVPECGHVHGVTAPLCPALVKHMAAV